MRGVDHQNSKRVISLVTGRREMTQTMTTDKVRALLRELSQLMLVAQDTGHGEAHDCYADAYQLVHNAWRNKR